MFVNNTSNLSTNSFSYVSSLQQALREVMLERERFKNKIELYFKVILHPIPSLMYIFQHTNSKFPDVLQMKVWDPPSVIDDNPGFENEESTDEE